MPLNQLKRYNDLLDIAGLSEQNRNISLRGIFDRDITNNQPFTFRGKLIIPTPQDGAIEMETLFTHLIKVKVCEITRRREFDIHRSQRLHWLRYHIDERKDNNMMCFSVKEPDGYRTYIYDIEEKYVVVLEPKHDNTIYFLLSAHNLRGKDLERDKIKKKYKRRLDELL